MSQAIEQPTPATPAAAPAEQPQNDIYADDFTEDMLSQMLDDDKTAVDESPVIDGEDAPPADEEVKEPAKEEPKTPEDAAPAEEAKADEPPDAYEIPLFGQNTKLTADQLIQVAEAGAQFLQHRPQVEKAMQLFQAVQGDANLQAVLQAYSNGQPLPQHGVPQQPAQPTHQPSTPEEALAMLRQQVMEQALPHLLPQIMRAVEEKYKPFVEDVNSFAAEARREKAFAQYKSDPDYSDVNILMTQNLQAKVAEGAISMQQAAEIDAKLRADPELFGQWFGKFKAALQKSKEQPAAAPQNVQKVSHAPRLEGSATAAAATAEKAQQAMAKALSGDAEAFNTLFENQ